MDNIMYRFIISLLTIFFVFVGGIARADDNNLVILDDNDTAISNPSCVADILGTSGDKIAVMTPVFEYICGAGYQPNATNDGCEPITQNCPAGTYLYINENTNVATCEPCPCGSYCAGGDLSANTENGGAVTCPTGTTTGLCSPTSPYGKGNSVVEQCNWHICEPGQQLKVEDGVASCQPCDENHYCLGGTYDAEHVNQSMQPCPTKANAGAGTSEAGSFRCSYQCAAGQAMEVIGNWYERASDCIPCPVGSYCPGDNGAAASYFTPTVYAEGVDLNEFNVDDEIYGATACEGEQTTAEPGATSASACASEHHCEPGYYWNISLQQCESCARGLSAFTGTVDQNLIYCPGGDFADIEDPATPGKVGLYLCPQYYVQEQHSNEWSTVFDPANPDSTSTYFNIYVANNSRDACGCPDGYEWTAQGTCCKEGEFCCPRGQKAVSVSGVQTCQACSADEDCPGTVVRVNCTPNAEENEYFNGETCVSCGAGSEPLATTNNACVCTRELLAEIYPNEPHDSDDDLVRAWNRDTNSCDYKTYNVVVNYTLIESGAVSAGEQNVWSQSYNYGDEAFDVDFVPQLNGYEFIGWCKGTDFCRGDDLIPANEKITIDPKDSSNRKDAVEYYAQMRLLTFACSRGQYLNPDTLEREDCPAGSYCPGDDDCSVSNTGKMDCPQGTYNPDTGATEATACQACPNNTTTAESGTISADQCGYFCAPGKYAAAGSMVCDQNCQEGNYCPGDGANGERFYTEAGQGMFACPDGLESDTDHCHITCDATEYAKKGDNGGYSCVPCDGNIPAEHAYYYCPGGQIDITSTNDGLELASEGGRYSCENGQVSDEPASECHDGYASGTYSDGGVSHECLSNYYCPGGSTSDAFKCPDGSISDAGSANITDCKCLSDTALTDGELPQYRPDGVYAEKGAGLFRVGDGDYVCVNTYVVVDNATSFENPGENSEIPTAGARVVACQWDGNQTNGTYDKCTDKAMKICYENMWSDADTGLASENVTTTDVLDTLATAFGTTASADMFGDTASVADIEVVGNECPAPGCSPEYPHYNDDENHCYAAITYNTNGGELPEGVTNPDVYAANDLSIVLNNPVKDHYKFEGWCLEGEDDDVCSANNTVTDGVVVRTIETGSGDLAFNATWSPVVYSIEYVLNDGTQAENPVTSYTVEDEDITLKDPHQDGYNFLGWYDNSETTGTKVTTIPAGSYGNKTFWAKWERSAYTVKYNANATDAIGTKDNAECYYGQPCTISNTGMTRPDFDLVGWATTPDATTTIDSPMTQTELLPGNEITLYAVWGPVCNSRKWLHIGNQRMCLYKNKYTDTALATNIDGQTYYLNMCKDCEKTITEGSNKQLRIKYNNDVYNIYDLTAE